MNLGTTALIICLEQMGNSQKYNWLCYERGNCNL